MLYASYHSLRGAIPHREDVWITYLTDFGLDPADNMDLTTAAGIGAAAGKGAMAARLHDGMNQTGIYADNTGYQGAAVQNHLGPADFARVDFLSMLAAIDSSIVTWQEKWRYDAVRPVSAIQHVYGDELVTAWGGPGMGTMEIPAVNGGVISLRPIILNIRRHPPAVVTPMVSRCGATLVPMS